MGRSFALLLWIIVSVDGLAHHEAASSMRRRFLASICIVGSSTASGSSSTAAADPLAFMVQPDAFFGKVPPKKPSKQRQMQELQDVRLDQCDKADLTRFDQCFFYGNGAGSTNRGRFLTPKTVRNGPPTW